MEGFLLDMVATGQLRRGEAVSVTFSDAPLFDDALTDFGLPGLALTALFLGSVLEERSLDASAC